MEITTKKRLHLVTGRSHPALAEAVAGHLGVALADANVVDFPNSEVRCRFGENIRGADVFIIQTHSAAVNESIMEQLVMIDAAKRASAKRITAVCPYYGYSRQDRKASGREPITAKLVADLFTAAGADRIVSVDLHSGQIQGFFDGPFDHLTAMPVLVEHLRSHVEGELVVVAPDGGRAKVAEKYAQHLNADLATVYKRRDRRVTGNVEALGVMGSDVVAGRTCVLVDDMIDTAGTICAAADQLKQHGASEIYAAATHGVLSGPAIERLGNSVISKVLITDTLPVPDTAGGLIEVLPIARLLAEAINAVFDDRSVSELFGGDNQT